MTHNRFDYVKYDERAEVTQGSFKEAFIALEHKVGFLEDSRHKALALTKLEEAYMWIGKAIRDDQVKRNQNTALMEERKDG